MESDPTICQTQCPNWNSGGPQRWFAKVRKQAPNLRSKSSCRPGPPCPLLRLSSTGDSVSDDIANCVDLDLSVLTVEGSGTAAQSGRGSTSRQPRPAVPTGAGALHRFSDFGFCKQQLQQTSTMNPGKPWPNQVELDALVGKFAGPRGAAPERPHRSPHGHMNGFVEEGVYRPYAPPTPGLSDSRGSLLGAAAPSQLRFLNVSGLCGVRRYHQHPYATWNHFAPGNRLGPAQFWAGQPPCPYPTPVAQTCTRPTLKSQPPSAPAQSRRHCGPKRTALPRQPQPQSQPHFSPVPTNCSPDVTHLSLSKSVPIPCKGRPHQPTLIPPVCPKNTPTPRQNKSSCDTVIRVPQIDDSLSDDPSRTVTSRIPQPHPSSQDCQPSPTPITSQSSGGDRQTASELVSGLCDLQVELKQTLLSQPAISSSVCSSSHQTDLTSTVEPQSQDPIGPKSEDKQMSGETPDSQTLEVECSLSSSPILSETKDVAQSQFDGRMDLQTDCQSEVLSEPELTFDLKPLHSSLAFLLSGVTPSPTSDISSDSDWDSDDDDASSLSRSPDSWDFLGCWDDPYNPLYGWKCGKRVDGSNAAPIEGAMPTELDVAVGDDEMDSGISSLQTQQDESDGEDESADSEAWDEAECDETTPGQLDQLWKAVCPTSDPLNPLSGWMCATPAEPAPELRKTRRKRRRHRVESRESRPSLETDRDATAKSPMKSVALADSSKNMHPSVLYILGIGAAESNSDQDDDDTSDDDSSVCSDDDWEAFQTSPDPYNPLQGTCLRPVVLEDSASDMKTRGRPESVEPVRRRISALGCGSLSLAKPPLKRASSTGCLWIPTEEQGAGRPFRNKKVHFCTLSPTVISFEVPKWSDEYCASRKGPWQEMARDRCRFRDRIHGMEPQIAPVLTPEHRQKVRQRLGIPTA